MAVSHGRGLRPHGVGDRTFVLAFVASIVAHALILLAAPWWLDPSRKRLSIPPIVAHLAPLRLGPEPVPVIEPRPDPKKVGKELHPVRARPPAPITRPAPSPPSIVEAPAPQARPELEVPGPAVTASPPPVAAIPSARPEPSPPANARIAAEASDPLTLGQYRIAIIAAAKRYKKYPRLALDNNWEGQAEIRMVIGADGMIASISIKTRSGFEVLDQQALEMIRQAKSLAPIPTALRGKGFTVDVPVVFSLKDETG